MTFREIKKRQVKEGQLRMLLAQRRLHSWAKNWAGWQLAVLVLLPALAAVCAQLPGCPQGLTTFVALLALCLDITVFERTVKLVKHKAVNIQEQFDGAVLGLSWPTWKMATKVDSAIYSHEKGAEFEEQVKAEKLMDWYHEPKGRTTPERLVLGCQKQNLIYSELLRDDLFKSMLYGLVAILLTEIVVLYALKLPLGTFFVKYFAAVIPLITWLVRELFRIYEYQKRLRHLFGFVEAQLEKKPTAGLLRNVQDEIIELRKIAPVVYDFHDWRRRPALEQMISI